MLGVSDMLGCSSDGKDAAEGGAGPASGEGLGEDEKMKFEDGERSSGGGNRWPRQETLALLKIRSDMDAAFRDSSLKGPLWDDVSRKMAEHGFHRSAKKCKEKFENVYKYHKRTKDGRSAKSEGKTYRFFEQLEAFDQNQPSSQFPPLPPLPPRPQSQGPESPTPVAMAMPPGIHHQIFPQVTVASTPMVVNVPPPPSPVAQNLYTPNRLQSLNPNPPPTAAAPASATIGMNTTTPNPCLSPNLNTNLDYVSDPSSSTSDEEEPKRRRRRKRKWESFFQRLMNEVIEKQEEMQKRFLETLERREREWVAREEAWRVQEIARINREHDLLAQERSKAAAKDSAMIAYLNEVSDQCQQIPNAAQVQTPTKLQIPVQAHENSNSNRNPDSNPKPIPQAPPQPPPPQQVQQPLLPHQFQPPQAQPQTQLQLQPYDNPRNGNGRENYLQASSSRWPKAEIEALIQLRTTMDVKYQENGPKGPLWEEISAEMKKIGYNRNAKRCKEKWENINKYFKKVKESNKKRPEDSKTCPYYHLLDAIYRERAKSENKPIMVQPEQQWPMAPAAEDQESEDIGDEEEEDDEGCGGYEIVTNKQASAVGAVGHE